MLDGLTETQQWITLLVLLTGTFGFFGYMVWESWRNVTFWHEEIASAAVRYPDIGVLHLPAPARHHHVMWTRLMIDGQYTGGDCEQGFVTTNGRFVGREEGLRIATKRGQIIEKHGNPGMLFSEDMWPTPPEARGWRICHEDD